MKKSSRTAASVAFETALKAQLLKLTPEAYNEIRQAYYEAGDALNRLFEALEEHAPAEGGAMIEAHLMIGQACEAHGKTEIGRIM